MKELIIKLCRGKILRDKLESGYTDGYLEGISKDPEGYVRQPDHHWRYNPNWKDYHNNKDWYTYRQGSVIAQLIKESGYQGQMKNFYKWCKEVFNDGD